MAPPSVTVGGKDASLTPAVVYAVASGLRSVKIDSAAFDKLSQSKKSTPLLSPPSLSSPLPSTPLPSPSARAALLVLLSKLLLPSAAARPAIPHLLEKTLTLPSSLDSLDFASPLSLLTTLRELAGSTDDSIELTTSELIIIESSPFASTAICAMLDHTVTSLARVADAVAALSCEAARANVSDADCAVGKYQAEVASAMKELLHGSKLVGQTESSAYASIPAVHGRFCKGVKILHEGVREELKSSAKVEKRGGQVNYEGEEDLLAVVSPIALAIVAMGRISLDRAKAVVELIGDQDMRVKVGEAIEQGCPKFDELRRKVDQFRTVDATCRTDYILAFQNVYEAMSIPRQMIAWEAALALFALEIDESVEKAVTGPQASIKENGENSKGDKKGKKSKKKTLGKGTSVVRQLILEQLVYRNQTSIGDVGVMAEWAQKLTTYFDPKDLGLDALLLKVKEILESNDARRLPKIPKGTRDFGKEQMAIRERAFAIIQRVFKMHGATALDTPVFELRETLMGKYGEDSKLIYDLADQGGELCSLRYDLTVPFARYLAMNNVSALKRYQVAKVYRRDNPSKGRYREFYQCDFDIAGQYETMEPDFEVVKVLTQLLDQLDIGDYEIKLNHRKLLDGMLDICGVSSDKFRTVCSSIDKLDKQSFEQVKKELVEEKGLAVETAEKIGTFVSKRGPPLEILSDLKSEGSQFLENNGSLLALNELEILFKALEKCKCLHRVVFDLSLARGLDYYTGVIFEAIFKGTTQVGSIAAGGRYDNLVGMFSGKQVPAVGVSLGIERVFTIMEQLEKDRNQVIRATETQVLVAILGKDVTLAAELVGELWDAGISAEFGLTKRVMNHINRAKQSGIPWMVIMGESEISSGVVNLKDIEASQEYVVPRAKMVEELKSRLNIA